MTHYIYSIAGHFLPSKVKSRKAPADPTKIKPYTFAPMADNGVDRVKVNRYTVNGETFAAWLDSNFDSATLAGVEPIETASNVAPTRGQVLAALAAFGPERWTAALASGWMAVPSDRAERASGTAANGRALTAEEKAAAALADMFAELEAATATATSDEPSDGTAEHTTDSEPAAVEPEPNSKASRR